MKSERVRAPRSAQASRRRPNSSWLTLKTTTRVRGLAIMVVYWNAGVSTSETQLPGIRQIQLKSSARGGSKAHAMYTPGQAAAMLIVSCCRKSEPALRHGHQVVPVGLDFMPGEGDRLVIRLIVSRSYNGVN